ncbi:aldo/keto reductase [Streptomyces sp. RG38]|uniref:Aldo/keto reductase n=1 Tax=Streptomyces tagetis TaxID=2820809 RepID=A0A940XEF8_9ACTN|nr:aldo/keto reductase [Streptomyces sp. RG38]
MSFPVRNASGHLIVDHGSTNVHDPKDQKPVSSKVPPITLNNGVEMPQLGFGVWQVPDDEAERAVATALEAGYRSIDTAAIYGNEEGTGRAVAASGVAREDLFITTKVWNSDQGYDSTLRAFDSSLEKLGLDHVDLYLIHWPVPALDRHVDTYKAFEKLHADGRVRAIGVSNFLPEHLERLIGETSVVPAVNQIELHPQLQQGAARAFHEERGIATEAWSPLGSGKGLLEVPAIVAIARKHDRTPAQVVLRWHLQVGNVVIPKSVTPSRIAENIAVFDFELDAEDLAAVSALDEGRRLGPDPAEFNVGA